MRDMKLFFISVAMMIAGALFTAASAGEYKTINAEEFLKRASAKSMTEIETSKLALKETHSPAVQELARALIDDHSAIYHKLNVIADAKKIDTPEDATLMGKVRKQILDMRNGTSFDIAYANNQVDAHKRTIELFERAAHSEDKEVKAFAIATLPTLEHHLEMVERIAEVTHDIDEKNNADVESITEMKTNGATTIPPRDL